MYGRVGVHVGGGWGVMGGMRVRGGMWVGGAEKVSVRGVDVDEKYA